jgi:5'-nucleotidase
MRTINLLLTVVLIGLFSVFALPASAAVSSVTIKLLGINDFHGQVTSGRQSAKRPVGSAPVLAAYLRSAAKGMESRTLITLEGDIVGASVPESGLLQDEPAILFFNTLGNTHCSTTSRMDPACNIVATVGNHEFDKGRQRLFDMIYGTDAPPTHHWTALAHYPGATFPYISANIVDSATGKTVFPPYIIKHADSNTKCNTPFFT